MREIASWVIVAFGALLCASCVDSQRAADEGEAGPDAGAAVELGGACDRDEDCAAGLSCDGDHPAATGSGCAATWICSDEDTCSAAAPYWACDCRGRAFMAAAMCSGRKHAGRLEMGVVEDVTDEPCDPDDLDGFRFDLRLDAVGFQAYAAAPARVLARWVGPESEARRGVGGLFVEEDGRMEGIWRDVVRPGAGSHQIEVLADANSDGRCDPAVDGVWRVETQGHRDQRAELDAATPSDPDLCATWADARGR